MDIVLNCGTSNFSTIWREKKICRMDGLLDNHLFHIYDFPPKNYSKCPITCDKSMFIAIKNTSEIQNYPLSPFLCTLGCSRTYNRSIV